MYNIHYVIRVILFQEGEYLEFDASLVLVLLFVLHNFERDLLFSFVVEAPQCLMSVIKNLKLTVPNEPLPRNYMTSYL